MKILLACSDRDAALSRMVNVIRNGSFTFSRESGDQFQAWLGNMMARARDTLPGIGLYLFHIPDKQQKKNGLTIHCIIGKKAVYEHKIGCVSCMEWINNAVNGEIKICGLERFN